MTPKQINKRLIEISKESEQLRLLVEGLTDEVEAFTSEKSDRWHEGDTGLAYEDFLAELYDWAGAMESIPELNL